MEVRTFTIIKEFINTIKDKIDEEIERGDDDKTWRNAEENAKKIVADE